MTSGHIGRATLRERQAGCGVGFGVRRGLTHAAARHITPYGLAACAWKIENDELTVEAEIPANTTAVVYLPGAEGAPHEVGAGRYRWSVPYQTPSVTHPALTLDSTVGDLIDHPAAYAAVMRVVAQISKDFADRLDGRVSVSLRQATRMNPNAQAMQAAIEATLAEFVGE